MDIFITIVLWIGGFFAFFILSLTLVFAGGGAAQTGKSELKMMSVFSFILMIFLVWTGISSLSSDVEQNVPVAKSVVSSTSSDVKASIHVGNDNFETYMEIISWGSFGIFFIIFFLWLFAPSKNKGEGRDLVKKKFQGTIKLEDDDEGRKPWDPNWEPKDDTK